MSHDHDSIVSTHATGRSDAHLAAPTLSRRAVRVAASFVFAVAIGSSSHAASSPQDRAAAQTLFDSALALMGHGSFAEACPKLEESQRLDPGQGTQFHLARCYEGEGRVASAWILYVDVADTAKASGLAEREKVAQQRAAAVAPRIPKLQIDVAVPGQNAEVRRNGEVVGAPQWGIPFPVDPGKQTISARLAGHHAFDVEVELKEGASTRVLVPELASLPPNAVAAASAPPAASASPVASSAPPTTLGAQPPATSSRTTVALVLGGAGVVGLGAGLVIGLLAKSKYDGAASSCPNGACDSAGYDTRSDAVKTANIGTIVGTVGLVAAAAGAVLWVTAPSSDAPAVGASMGRVVLEARF